MFTRVRSFAPLAFLVLVAGVNPGCLCVDATPPPEKAPEETPQDKLKSCLTRCDGARYSCQHGCNKDDICSRACVSSYDKCIDICGGRP